EAAVERLRPIILIGREEHQVAAAPAALLERSQDHRAGIAMAAVLRERGDVLDLGGAAVVVEIRVGDHLAADHHGEEACPDGPGDQELGVEELLHDRWCRPRVAGQLPPPGEPQGGLLDPPAPPPGGRARPPRGASRKAASSTSRTSSVGAVRPGGRRCAISSPRWSCQPSAAKPEASRAPGGWWRTMIIGGSKRPAPPASSSADTDPGSASTSR